MSISSAFIFIIIAFIFQDLHAAGAKVGLIILSALVALGLIYAIAALACTLSCGGSEGAAVLVMVGGVGPMVFLLFSALRAILGKKKKPKKTDIPPRPFRKVNN